MTTIDELIDKLEPCPFCGGTNLEIRANGIGDYYVICTSIEPSEVFCGASTSDRNCEMPEKAVRRWNRRWITRAPDPAISTLQEQKRKLEEVLAELLAAPPVVEVFGPQVTDCECPFCRARALLSGGGE